MTTAQSVLDRLAVLEGRVRQVLAARQAADPRADDAFRGLYLSDEMIETLLEEPRGPLTGGEPTGPPATADPSRLGRLAAGAQLSELDTELLLIAVAPDVDSRFEQFFGYLNDDVTRRRATVGLALRLCGLPENSAIGRTRLTGDAPLMRTGLVAVEDTDRPLLSRQLRVPDRVAAYLLGDDRPDATLTSVCWPDDLADLPALPGATELARALRAGTSLTYLRELAGGSGLALAAAALALAGRPPLPINLEVLESGESDGSTLRGLLVEALLTGAGIIAGPLGTDGGRALRVTVELMVRAAVPLIVFGPSRWDPRWSDRAPLRADAAPVGPALRDELWHGGLDGSLAVGVEPTDVTAQFILSPVQIRRAAAAARTLAVADGDSGVQAAHLRQGARDQNAAGLERLARRIEPAVGWADLVLPDQVAGQLGELSARARHRERVLTDWRMRPGGGRGRGVTALFAGDSGTGKTMSAEVIAGDLGLDLYTVNLATVVDKYVGETEKNLERIFTEAAGVNGVLLFDEADAIFGKRSEVRDAHDRYANMESAYLLQRIETFDGLAILATNLRANLDEAFTRRLDIVVDFPVPDEPLRRALWDACLGRTLPRSSDVDLDFLAASFELAGGHIRSAAVTAAYLAAEADRSVSMADLAGAVAREYRKLGRLVLEREFGKYVGVLSGRSQSAF
ncbi:ATP-binding protein [Fodinicola feengrottensis]|uniref:ATP-binding protein n=1 Tax=Fodinicola feengrottensis TaxID=435914 RepID=A0ABP4RVE4_9ACTN